MIVYRCVSEREIASMIGIDNDIQSPFGENTFTYDKNTLYKHFFYYYDSAVSFMKAQNDDRYYDKYSIIMAYDIDDEILKENFGLGKYNLKCVRKELKDSIFQFFESIYYPEFAIPNCLITKDMIAGIGNEKRITPVGDSDYGYMSDTILKSEKDFLEYEKWLFSHGTNLSLEEILEHKEELFPIGRVGVNRK